jgi:superfamily I DNA/RNA helicase
LKLAGKATGHPELAAFKSWGAVQEYVRTEDGAEDLAVFVRLVDKHGPAVLIDGVDALVDEQRGRPTTTISTAHKAKGREWDAARVGGDFFEPGLDEHGQVQRLDKSEAMLCYVTVARAKRRLDNASLRWVGRYLAGQVSPEQRRRWAERQAAKRADDDAAPGSLAAVEQFVREQRAEEREYTND